jgi:hypothetical protein
MILVFTQAEMGSKPVRSTNQFSRLFQPFSIVTINRTVTRLERTSGNMQKAKLLTITALIAVLSLSGCVLAASATNVPSFSVIELSELPIELPAGTTFNGTIAASGLVRVWVVAPEGAQGISLGIVDKPTSFSFVATKEGNYTLYFENGAHTSNPVQVNFSFTTDPDITSDDQQSGKPLIDTAALVAVGVIGSVLIFFTIRRGERRKQRSQV